MNITEKIVKKIQSVLEKNEIPLIVFDIDDTLIDCRYRKRDVFLEFCKRKEVLKNFPEEARLIRNSGIDDICYRVSDCLVNLGISDTQFSDDLHKFWLEHYFTYPFLIHDIPFPGAEDLAIKLWEHQAHIIYLTGRDETKMGLGTSQMLETLRFPSEPDRTKLILKPDSAMDDFSYKADALHKISQYGTVVACFENELKNLNKMAEFFPEAYMMWRDTLFLPNPPSPHPRVERLSKFS